MGNKQLSKRWRAKRKQAMQLGAIRPLLLVFPLPDDLVRRVMHDWPEGHLSRKKVETYIRHRLTNYDALRWSLHRQRYDELKAIADEKITAALDEWMLRHPEQSRFLMEA